MKVYLETGELPPEKERAVFETESEEDDKPTTSGSTSVERSKSVIHAGDTKSRAKAFKKMKTLKKKLLRDVTRNTLAIEKAIKAFDKSSEIVLNELNKPK